MKKSFNKFVYKHTTKPTEYKHVDKHRNLQDFRQDQYNNWSKFYKVYSGSFLPENPNDLLNQNWTYNLKRMKNTNINDLKNIDYINQRTGQEVRYDLEQYNSFAHYHWYNPKATEKKCDNNIKFYDRYKNIVPYGNFSSHLSPLDAEFEQKPFIIPNKKNKNKGAK